MSNKLMILAMTTSGSCFASGENIDDMFVNDVCKHIDSCESMNLSSNEALFEVKCGNKFYIDRTTVRNLLEKKLGELTSNGEEESSTINIRITNDYVFSFKFEIINIA